MYYISSIYYISTHGSEFQYINIYINKAGVKLSSSTEQMCMYMDCLKQFHVRVLFVDVSSSVHYTPVQWRHMNIMESQITDNSAF